MPGHSPATAPPAAPLHFPGQSQRHSGFSLGFSLGKGGSEPRETLRLGAGLLEPRPVSGPRWTQGPSHCLEEEAGGVPGAPRGGGGRPEPWPRPAPPSPPAWSRGSPCGLCGRVRPGKRVTGAGARVLGRLPHPRPRPPVGECAAAGTKLRAQRSGRLELEGTERAPHGFPSNVNQEAPRAVAIGAPTRGHT